MPNLRWTMDADDAKANAARNAPPGFRGTTTVNGGEGGQRMRKNSGSGLGKTSVLPGDDVSSANTVTSVCVGCGLPIVDRYILRVMELSWHESCLQCSVCHAHLQESCYSRDRKLFCKADYDKLFGVKCAGCLGGIGPSELVMRALEHVFHVSCFACVVCCRALQKGDQFVVRAGRLYCRPDYEKELALVSLAPHGNGAPGVRGESNGGPLVSQNGQGTGTGPQQPRPDGRRGPKRPRTILTTAQRRAFKASFEISQKPCRKVRETLAKETGLSVRIVQVWFQNQRAKLKKIQRKQQQQQQQQQNQPGQGDSSGSEMASSTKDSKKSDDGRQSASPTDLGSPPYSRLGLLDSSAVGSPYQLQPVSYGSHHDGSYYGPTHGDPSYLKSEISMESETSLSGLEDVLIGQQGHPAEGHPLFGSAAPTVNPIDKLYSMQTSYFSNNECECLGATN
ncbi:LIM homeobox transcription factor 1-beta-like isoform X2 [Ornithodoros turicata]